MSMDKSLKVDKFRKIRRVRKRHERVAKLKRNEKWIEGMSVYGLPKEKIEQIKIKIKDKIKDEEKDKDLVSLAEEIRNKNDKEE